MDICSETADGFVANSANGGIAYGLDAVGDDWINSTDPCVQLTPNNCDCEMEDGGGGTYCPNDYRLTHGWRNEVQVTRFLWDLIDANNETGDTTSYGLGGVNGLVSKLEAMSTENHVHGSANEPERDGSHPDCIPSDPYAGAMIPIPIGGRDTNNVFDLDYVISDDLSSVRALNCVTGGEHPTE